MRVLQFYRTYRPETRGGLEEAIRQICLSTGKLGVSQRVLTLAKVRQQECINLPEADVLRIPLQADIASCSMGMGLFKAYKEQAAWADIIHIHYPWPFADLVHVLSRVDKPVVLTYQADIIRQKKFEPLYNPLRKRFFRRVNKIVATSPNYVETSPFLQSLTDAPEVIPLGLDPDSYTPPSEQALKEVYERFGEGFFLFVGVLRYYKGLHHLVKAAALCQLPVVIAGLGPETGRLKRMAKELGAVNVHFTGFISDDQKQALYHYCRGVVFPSCERSEAFGMTLLEGQLNAKPLISCEIGTGTSYVNMHGESGLVIAPNDPEALAASMSILHKDTALASRLGRGGNLRLNRLFTGEQVGKRYLSLYKQLV